MLCLLCGKKSAIGTASLVSSEGLGRWLWVSGVADCYLPIEMRQLPSLARCRRTLSFVESAFS